MNNPFWGLRVRRIEGIISTEDIMPARYKHGSTDLAELARHLFENYRPGFAATIQTGDILVADDVFGIGSSREQAVSAMKVAGVRAIIAPAFGRILFRNAWNIGLPALELVDETFAEGELLNVDLEEGQVCHIHGITRLLPIPVRLVESVRAGGLLSMLATSR